MKANLLIAATCAGLTLISCETNHRQTKTSDEHPIAITGNYACPMHPGVTGNAGDSCSKCGMTLEKTNAHPEIAMTLKTGSLPESGKAVTLIFTPAIINNSSDVELEEIHERLLHVIVLNDHLSWFSHIHAEPDGKGSYQVTETFPAGGNFIVYADYKVKGYSPRIDKFELSVKGEPLPSATLETNRFTKTDGYRVTIDRKDLTTGALEIPIAIAKDGYDLKRADIENYLGAAAHIILINYDEKSFLHIHPESTLQYPIVGHAEVSKPGIYRMWVQFQTNGVVHTAAFTLNITAPGVTSATPKKHNH